MKGEDRQMITAWLGTYTVQEIDKMLDEVEKALTDICKYKGCSSACPFRHYCDDLCSLRDYLKDYRPKALARMKRNAP